MDPVLELQGAIISRLRAYAPVSALVGSRVYDIAPQGAPFPHIAIGPSNFVSDDADCISSGEAMIQVDAWSDYAGQMEVRQMADAIRKAFRDYEFTLATNALVTFDHWRTDYTANGEIKHASVRFTAIIEQP